MGEGTVRVLSCRLPLHPKGRWGVGVVERTHMTDYLISAGQEILDWLIKIAFLVRIETTVK